MGAKYPKPLLEFAWRCADVYFLEEAFLEKPPHMVDCSVSIVNGHYRVVKVIPLCEPMSLQVEEDEPLHKEKKKSQALDEEKAEKKFVTRIIHPGTVVLTNCDHPEVVLELRITKDCVVEGNLSNKEWITCHLGRFKEETMSPKNCSNTVSVVNQYDAEVNVEWLFLCRSGLRPEELSNWEPLPAAVKWCEAHCTTNDIVTASTATTLISTSTSIVSTTSTATTTEALAPSSEGPAAVAATTLSTINKKNIAGPTWKTRTLVEKEREFKRRTNE